MPVLVAIGTRPEAIKLCPVVLALGRHPQLEPVVVATGQHGELVDDALRCFEVVPDIALVGEPGQSLAQVASRVVLGIEAAIEAVQPGMVVVQGDTTSAVAAALAGSYTRTPVAHVEAGLRTFDPGRPYPEEVNRRVIAQLADLHFPVAPHGAANLRREGIGGSSIVVTGNPVIDALHHVLGERRAAHVDGLLASSGRLIVVTVHRRESWGQPMVGIGEALAAAARAHPSDRFVVVLHPNSSASVPLRAALDGLDNVALREALSYPEMVGLLDAADLMVTDSGGLQEEAPALGTRLIVLRNETERPEGVHTGGAVLVGTDAGSIRDAIQASLQLDRPSPSPPDLYGDGRASERIAAAIAWRLLDGPRPDAWVGPLTAANT